MAILAFGIFSGCQAPFPKVSEASRVHIQLTRSWCYGGCPAYVVDVTEDGSVIYEGTSSVAVSGRFQDRIPPTAVAALVGLFDRADFFSLRDEYSASFPDGVSYTISLTVDGRTKTVRDYEGQTVGMPAIIRELEDAIDRTAGTAKFVKGTPETIEVLRKAGFNFSSPQAGVYLADALEIGSYAYARAYRSGRPSRRPDDASATAIPATDRRGLA